MVVTQEAFLFCGSVADNIALGRSGATSDEIDAAASAVPGPDEFIRALPEGYDTDVNKRGGRLSAGQAPAGAFARCLVAQPRVLILDERSSSLDMPSEAMVQRALERLLVGRTGDHYRAPALHGRPSRTEWWLCSTAASSPTGPPEKLARQGGA